MVAAIGGTFAMGSVAIPSILGNAAAAGISGTFARTCAGSGG